MSSSADPRASRFSAQIPRIPGPLWPHQSHGGRAGGHGGRFWAAGPGSSHETLICTGTKSQTVLQFCFRPDQPSAVGQEPPRGLQRPSTDPPSPLGLGSPSAQTVGTDARAPVGCPPPRPLPFRKETEAQSHGVLGEVPPWDRGFTHTQAAAPGEIHPELQCPTTHPTQAQFPGLAETREVIWFSRPGQVTPPSSSLPGGWHLAPLCLPGTRQHQPHPLWLPPLLPQGGWVRPGQVQERLDPAT